MAKIPAGTERYQQLLRESKTLVERLRNGEKMLTEALNRQSAASAFDVIRLYGSLSTQLLDKMEEMALVHQFYALGITGSIDRAGRFVTTADLALEGTVELDPATLMALEKLKNVFGEIPFDILSFQN